VRRIFHATSFLLLSIQGFPQTYTPPAYAEIDNNHWNYVYQLFGALEAHRGPASLSMDYAFDFRNPLLKHRKKVELLSIFKVDKYFIKQMLFVLLY
jgi:hypothetical protein